MFPCSRFASFVGLSALRALGCAGQSRERPRPGSSSGALTECGCVGAAGEDRADAGDGLNASLAARKLCCERNSAPRPLLEPTGLFAGG